MHYIVVDFTVYEFDICPSGKDIRSRLQASLDIGGECEVVLKIDGLDLDDNAILCEDMAVVQMTLNNGMSGGKGGFGAMLRSQAKQKGKTKTTDFGACRDLSGRRLRHINDEIILNKWKEAKDRGEAFDPEQETATGIDLWYLSAPSWAEGIKVDKRKKFMKPRMKTTLCIDWERARQTRSAPTGAPNHWGCPRGARCEYAHGEEELRGDALTAAKEAKEKARAEELSRKQDSYVGAVSRAAREDQEVEDLVRAGLRAAARGKAAVHRTKVGFVGDGVGSCDRKELNDTVSSSCIADVDEGKPRGSTEIPCCSAMLRGLSPSDVAVIDEQFTVTGTSSFGTVYAPLCEARPSVGIGSSNGWYYEVTLLSDGLMQIGWGTRTFVTASHIGEGDGVGDTDHSWAYDGFRQRCWHSGLDKEYGNTSDEGSSAWQAGDVVGCCLQFVPEKSSSGVGTDGCSSSSGSRQVSGCVRYSLNGVDLGVANEFQVSVAEIFMPALSLEKDERVAVNLGQAPFVFWKDAQLKSTSNEARPAKRSKLASSAEERKLLSIGGVTDATGLLRPVWESIPVGARLQLGFEVGEQPPEIADSHTEGRELLTDAHNSSPLSSIPLREKDDGFAHSTEATSAAKQQTARDVDSVEVWADLDIDGDSSYAQLDTLKALGAGQLKHELERRGMKAGGTVHERAERLLAVRGIPLSKIDGKLMVRKR